MPAGRPLKDTSLLHAQCEDAIASCDRIRELAHLLQGETGRELRLVQDSIETGAAGRNALMELETIELEELADEDAVCRVVNAMLRATHETLRKAGATELWPEYQATAERRLRRALHVHSGRPVAVASR